MKVRVMLSHLVLLAVLTSVGMAECCAGERQSITAEAVVRETNRERGERNVAKLKANSILNRIAEKRLRDMLDNAYFGHISPSGQDVAGIADSSNYRYMRIGENLARGNFKDAGDLVSFWMKSPPHRKNLLSPEFRDIGVALARERREGRLYWHAVQVFGTQHEDK